MVCLFAPTVMAESVSVSLRSRDQQAGNMGAAYRPQVSDGVMADFMLSARAGIDENSVFDALAPGSEAAIYFLSNGVGSQNMTGVGGGGIEGDEEGHEEILVNFDNPVPGDSVQVELRRFRAGDGWGDKDDPVLFVHVIDQGWRVFSEQTNLMDAYVQLGSSRGYFDFNVLEFNSETLIDKIVLREAAKDISLARLSYGLGQMVPLPTPVALAGFGLGLCAFVSTARRRR